MQDIQNLSILELNCIKGLLLFSKQVKNAGNECLQIIDHKVSLIRQDNGKQSGSDEDSHPASSPTSDYSTAQLDESTSSSEPSLGSCRRKHKSSRCPSPGRQDRRKRPNKARCISNDKIQIGDGEISVPMSAYKKLKWNNPSRATKGLLDILFTRSILATHNLSGKPSPAFPNRQVKGKLDEKIVKNIISEVVKKTNTDERIIRNAITQKCADTAKLQARQLNG